MVRPCCASSVRSPRASFLQSWRLLLFTSAKRELGAGGTPRINHFFIASILSREPVKKIHDQAFYSGVGHGDFSGHLNMPIERIRAFARSRCRASLDRTGEGPRPYMAFAWEKVRTELSDPHERFSRARAPAPHVSSRALLYFMNPGCGLIRSRFCAGGDGQAVPGIDGGDGQSQIGQLLLAEMRADFFVKPGRGRGRR